jgi:hypothetical protein
MGKRRYHGKTLARRQTINAKLAASANGAKSLLILDTYVLLSLTTYRGEYEPIT